MPRVGLATLEGMVVAKVGTNCFTSDVPSFSCLVVAKADASWRASYSDGMQAGRRKVRVDEDTASLYSTSCNLNSVTRDVSSNT